VQWLTALGVTLAVAMSALAPGVAPSPRRPAPSAATSHSRPRPHADPAATPSERAAAAELVLNDAQGVAGAPSSELAALTSAPGMPTCAPPPIPAATYPPTGSYGIPFLAAITNGQVLAGYDEWTANNLVWRAMGKTDDLYPWQSKIYDITGWVTGLLELPSLTAEIPGQDIVFCDSHGSSTCLSADWPAGQCVHILAQYGPSPASPAPPPAIGNDHPEGTSCYGYSTPTFECFPYAVSLSPYGKASLTVTGVEPDGALDLQVTTAAVTTVHEYPPPPVTTSFTCQDDPTVVTLSTVAPSGLPASAPPPPNPPNSDDRSLQTPPQPLTGPLATASSTVASDNFSIPAFVPSKSGSPCSLFLADSLNTYAGGWNSVFQDQDEGLYYIDGGNNPIVAPPGWAQFTATTTVVTFGLPVGPPPGFKF